MNKEIVLDVSDKLINIKTTSNESHNYNIRLESIRDYCNGVLEQESKDPNKNFNKSASSFQFFFVASGYMQVGDICVGEKW